jgi:precorrin-3B synthase
MNAPVRRHACPGLTDPMPTGDGLLARIVPRGTTMALGDATKLCAAARERGNGIIEVTSRGSVQVRGLCAESAADFAVAVMPLGLATAGVPIVTDPLAGLDRHALVDATALAETLRAAVAASLDGRLAAKVSIVVDGTGQGSAVHADAIAADVRLRAISTAQGVRLHVALAGNARDAIALGTCRPNDALAVAVGVLKVISGHGRAARARDVLREHGIGIFRAAVGFLIREAQALPPRPAADVLGAHQSSDDERRALGFGLAFGHIHVEQFAEMIATAERAGAVGLRTAPRAILFIGVAPQATAALVAAAERLGLIVRKDDPRRFIAACAGMPICTAAQIAARTLAPAIAAQGAALLDGSFMLHVSGCSKGCAHPKASALTIVGRGGRCGVVANGTASAVAVGEVAEAGLPRAMARLAAHVRRARAPNEGAADVIARLDPEHLRALLMEAAHD